MVVPRARTLDTETPAIGGLMPNANRTCTIDGCETKHYAKGWCQRHYKNNYDHGSPLLCRVKGTDPCTIDGCTVRASAKGLCPDHYLQAYYLATKKRDKAKRRAHYLANAEKYKERSQLQGAASRRAQPEKHRERNQLYAKTHPSIRRNSQERRRARKLDADVREFSDADWQKMVRRFDQCCAYCGQRKPLTQDHVIPLSRGGRHALSNLLPACRSCNASKGNKFLIEWRQYRRLIESLTLEAQNRGFC